MSPRSCLFVDWARRVLAAAEAGGAVAVGGRLVDAPVASRAQALLRRVPREETCGGPDHDGGRLQPW